jgi:hypothetical protein
MVDLASMLIATKSCSSTRPCNVVILDMVAFGKLSIVCLELDINDPWLDIEDVVQGGGSNGSINYYPAVV